MRGDTSPGLALHRRSLVLRMKRDRRAVDRTLLSRTSSTGLEVRERVETLHSAVLVADTSGGARVSSFGLSDDSSASGGDGRGSGSFDGDGGSCDAVGKSVLTVVDA